jgi:hypothetical protein
MQQAFENKISMEKRAVGSINQKSALKVGAYSFYCFAKLKADKRKTGKIFNLVWRRRSA